MSLRIYENHAAAKLNEAAAASVNPEIGSIGPVELALFNEGTANVVLAVHKKDGTQVSTNRDTSQSAEATGYTGNASTLAFSGESLDVLPVVPGSVVLTPATSGVNLKDTNKDGNLVTDDVDADQAGTIDYFTGAMVLAYPTGKAPNGAINADYISQDATLKGKARKIYLVDNVLQDEQIVPRVACDAAGGSPVKISGVATWI